MRFSLFFILIGDCPRPGNKILDLPQPSLWPLCRSLYRIKPLARPRIRPWLLTDVTAFHNWPELPKMEEIRWWISLKLPIQLLLVSKKFVRACIVNVPPWFANNDLVVLIIKFVTLFHILILLFYTNFLKFNFFIVFSFSEISRNISP